MIALALLFAAPAAAPLPAPTGVQVTATMAPASDGVVCSYKVTNPGKRFVVAVHLRPRDNSWAHKQLPPPPHWFQADGSDFAWFGDSPQVAIGPGESEVFAIELLRRSGTLENCGTLDANVGMADALPEPTVAARLTLAIPLLQVIPSNRAALVEATIELHNAGPGDALVNLGELYGNVESEPSRIYLTARDANGKTFSLHLRGRGFVAGRIDPLSLPLPEGATYSFHAAYWGGPTTPGRYRVTATLKSDSQHQLVNSGMAPIRFWLGTAESPEATLVVPPAP